MIEKLYTVEEVAELASVTGRTIRNYLKSGRLVGRKIGGQWRFPESEVQRLLTGGGTEADVYIEDSTEAPRGFEGHSSEPASDPIPAVQQAPALQEQPSYAEAPVQETSYSSPIQSQPPSAPVDQPVSYQLPAQGYPAQQQAHTQPVPVYIPQTPVQEPYQQTHRTQNQTYGGYNEPAPLPFSGAPYQAPGAQQLQTEGVHQNQMPPNSKELLPDEITLNTTPGSGSTPPPLTERYVKGIPDTKPCLPEIPQPQKKAVSDPSDVPLEALSGVGKKVMQFTSEVHDCSRGPQICTVMDTNQSLETARATIGRLGEIAKQETDAGTACRAYVEYDERYLIARYTLFGSNRFLARCLKIIG